MLADWDQEMGVTLEAVKVKVDMLNKDGSVISSEDFVTEMYLTDDQKSTRIV